MRAVGPVTTIVLCFAALVLSMTTTLSYGLGNAVSVGFASVSLIAMSQCLVLAARPRFLEPFFGGLDRMYYVHKWLGIAALGALLLHDQIEPDFEHWVRETAFGELGQGIGSVAYYGLVSLIVFSWIKRIPIIDWEIPYNLWWFTHRLIGAFFALVVLHQLLVDTPFDSTDPLLVFLNVMGVLGITCYVFIEFIAKKWRQRAYFVSSLKREAGATELSLQPRGRAMRWRPGQFAFLSAPKVGLGEPHPFTIASSPAEDTVRFMVKPLGDWTRRLPEDLQPGDAVRIEGPYGRFDFRKGSSQQIWIAGGIGITPFLAWVQSLSKDEDRSVRLFYSVRTASEAIGLDILNNAAACFPFFSFELVVTQRDGRLDAGRIVASAPFDPNDADFFFCGPVNLRHAILKDLESLDITPRRIRFELFEFR